MLSSQADFLGPLHHTWGKDEILLWEPGQEGPGLGSYTLKNSAYHRQEKT